MIARATSLAREHREQAAVELLQSQLRQHPKDAAAHRLLIRVFALSGDLSSARRQAEELGRLLGHASPEPWVELGKGYELAHDFEAALELYDHASEVAPESPRGPRVGGMRAAAWGEIAWAGPRLEEAAKRGADDTEFWHSLGLVRLHLHDVHGAESAYLRGLRGDPHDVACRLGLATAAVVRNDASEALRQYDAILLEHPSFRAGHLGKAWALRRLGREDEARTEEAVGGNSPATPPSR